MKQIKESCGIFGVFNTPSAAQLTYFGLHALQHRGQEASGMGAELAKVHFAGP